MSEVTQYSVGIDLGQMRWRVAIARAGIAEMWAAPDDRSSALSGAGGDLGLTGRVVVAVSELAHGFGRAPSSVVLCVSPDVLAGTVDLCGDVARRLGLRADQVSLIGQADAVARGLAHLNETGSGGVGLVTVDDQAAIGAALSGIMPNAEQMTTGLLATGAAGASGAAIGGAGAAMLAGPPTAVAAGTAGGVGPAGVPLSGPTGVPLSGPAGVPLSGGVVGPAGVPIVAAVVVRRFPLIPVLVGAAAVLIVAAGVAVVASGDDAAMTLPATTALVVVIPETVPATSIIVTTIALTTLAPTTVVSAAVATTEQPASTSSTSATTMPPATSSSCVVGSWLVDNDAFLAAFAQFAGSNQIALASVTGAVRLDIGSDGALVETYDNWLQTYTLPGGAGPAFISVTGVDTNTVVFAEDGTYSVTATQIGSHTKVWAADFVLVDGVSVLTMFMDSSAYTCSGDRLEIVTAAGTDFMEHDITMAFTRGG